jgi:hypothetical protein
MSAARHMDYMGYDIAITELAGRFTPRVTRAGALIAHDGRMSEAWTAASCGSFDRALTVARMAIDSKRIK